MLKNRMDEEQEREKTYETKRKGKTQKRGTITSININSLSGKRDEVEYYLSRTKCSVVALQETRVETGHWPIRLGGYNIFAADANPAIFSSRGIV